MEREVRLERALPQPGELWQHFKGHKYYIIGIGQDRGSTKPNKVIYVENWLSVIQELYNHSNFIIKDSEKDVFYLVNYVNNKWLLNYRLDIENRISVGWARPLEMFMNKKTCSDNLKVDRFTRLDLDNLSCLITYESC